MHQDSEIEAAKWHRIINFSIIIVMFPILKKSKSLLLHKINPCSKFECEFLYFYFGLNVIKPVVFNLLLACEGGKCHKNCSPFKYK